MMATIPPSPELSYTAAKNLGAYTSFAWPASAINMALGAVALRNKAMVGHWAPQIVFTAAFTRPASSNASLVGR
jgi:hypothetical protein